VSVSEFRDRLTGMPLRSIRATHRVSRNKFFRLFAMLTEDRLGSPAACGDADILSTRSALRTHPVPAYTITVRVLHWITALLILLAIPLGVISANDLGGPLQDWLYDLHRSFGAVLILIVIARLISRWVHPPVPLHPYGYSAGLSCRPSGLRTAHSQSSSFQFTG
jgi:hypothetical protein